MVSRSKILQLLATFVVVAMWVAESSGQSRLYQLTLKNGMTYEGRFDSIDEISKDLTKRNPTAGGVDVRPIVILDDQLRRVYFPKRNLLTTNDAEQETVVKIHKKRYPRKAVGGLGAVLGATPFDKHGRRTLTIIAGGGRTKVQQEIVEISPVYTQLQSPQLDLDMRIATSSIPSNELRAILLQHGNDNVETRFDLVRLLFLSRRYQDAVQELDLVVKQFPNIDKEKIERQRAALQQQGTDLLLKKIGVLRKAGRHKYASFLLRGFENTGAATESLIEASEMLTEYDQSKQKAEDVLTNLAPLVENADGDPPRLKMIGELHEEIKADLNIHNLPRLADFRNLVRGDGLTNDEKLAIGVSGWLLGQGQVIRNLEVAASLLEVRNLVREYLRAMGSDKRHVREELISRIRDREGGSPEYVAKILANLKPPLDMPSTGETPLMFEVNVPGTPDGFPVQYTVQLPPEYDPYAEYPVVLTLHPAGMEPESQIAWWAGDYNEQQQARVGLASLHGYIVIAPKWTKPKQGRYEYSAREHHVVLTALRDAMRRFAIDSDRMFISGHALGADAAWDLAVSHPEYWAGMVLFGARGDYGSDSAQYIKFYDQNAKYFPCYFVFGELDGDKIHQNAIHLNRYMRPGYDTIMVQYQGRGNEHFYEEIHNIFEWMELQQRTPAPKEFQVDSMRPWDNYFWYVELSGLPPKTMVSPFAWPVSKPSSSEITGRLTNNKVIVRSGGATRTTVFLSPDIVNFDERVRVTVNGKNSRDEIVPNLATMLEDARQRADRKHVYWAKVQVQTGR